MAHSVDKDYDLETILDTHRLGGGMLRDKAMALLEDWLVELYPRMKSQQTPTSTLLECGKVLLELSGMKGQQAQQGPVGPQFSISINLPAANGQGPMVITGNVQQDEQPLLSANFAPALAPTPVDLSGLPPIPKYLKRIHSANGDLCE